MLLKPCQHMLPIVFTVDGLAFFELLLIKLYFRKVSRRHSVNLNIWKNNLSVPINMSTTIIFTANGEVYTLTVCGWGRGMAGFWVVLDQLETIFCGSLTQYILPDSEPIKLLYHPKQKSRRGGGIRQINTCRTVPVQVIFLDNNIWHCFLSVWSFYALTSKHGSVYKPCVKCQMIEEQLQKLQSRLSWIPASSQAVEGL